MVATGISIVIALLGASGVFGELQDSLNTIWEVRPKPDRGIMGIIQDRFLSMTMVLGIAFLLLVSMFVTTVISGLSTSTIHMLVGGDGTFMQHILKGMNVVLSVVIITLLFAAIFRFLPDVKISWSDVWLGAFVTAALFEAGKFALSEYFVRGTPTSAYGAAGSLVAVLLWVYYSAYILFFGAEFTQVYANRFGSHIVPASNAEPLTEEMRARQGIPHTEESAAKPSPGKPGFAAAGGQRPTTPMRAASKTGRKSTDAALSPHSLRATLRKAERPSRRPSALPRKSYAGRVVPLFAAVVLGRFVYKRVEAHRLLHPTPAALATPSRWRQYAKFARSWATRRALDAALKLSETNTGRAVLRAGLKSKLLRV